MLRKTMMVLATAAVLSGGLTADAAALATAHSGWDGLGDGGAHAIVPTPAEPVRCSSVAVRSCSPCGNDSSRCSLTAD